MICAHLGLTPDFDQAAAYVEGWLHALKDDKWLIFRAASEAQKTTDMLMNVSASALPYAARLDAVEKLQGMSSSMRLLGWPPSNARKVAVR